MAALTCVCLVLALWMTGSRSATGSRAGSSDFGSHWDQAYFKITDQALRYRKSGDLRAAERAYEQGVDQAHRRGDRLGTVRFLMLAGGCRMLLYEYRSALAAFLEARAEALAIHDAVDVGAISGNLSSLYLQMWDLPAARRAADSALEVAAAQPSAYYIPQLLLQAGRLDALKGNARAESYYRHGITAAQQQGDRQTEARGWDWLGDQQLSCDALPEAQASFQKAYEIRTDTHSADIGFSYPRLGALRRAQGRLEDAGRFTHLALQAVRDGKPGWPLYLMLHQMGSVHLALGARDAALADFSEAIELTTKWRQGVLPSRSSLTSVNVTLEKKVFRSSIDLASGYAVRSHSDAWAGRAFEALELNRAASLRDSLALSEVWRTELPAEYWETVGSLEAAQSEALRSGGRDEGATSLLLKITEMEARAGLDFTGQSAESFRNRTSLTHFQAGLGASELFLSFFLGRESSYLWAVNRDGLHVYRLPAGHEIVAHSAAFRHAVLAGRAGVDADPEVYAAGRKLYRDLFGYLSSRERAGANWLLSLEGALFDVPFAALVEGSDGHTGYLVEQHSIQKVPGALLLSRRGSSLRRGGVSIGVYYAADARWARSTAMVPVFYRKSMPGQSAPAQWAPYQLAGGAGDESDGAKCQGDPCNVL